MSRRRTWVVGATVAALNVAGLVAQVALTLDGDWADGATLLVELVFAAVAGVMWTDRDHRSSAVLLGLAAACIGLGGLDSDAGRRWGGYWGELGWLVTWYQVPLVAVVLLRYPVPVARFAGQRLMVAGLVAVCLLRVPSSLFWSPAAAGYEGPGRWFTLVPHNRLATLLVEVTLPLTVVLTGWFVTVQVRRWSTATGPARLAVRLTAITAVLLAATLLGRTLVGLAAVPGWVDPGLDKPLSAASSVVGAVGAVLLLVVAVRRAVQRGEVVERLLAAAGDPTAVERVLRSNLQDDTLTVAYRLGGTWLDAAGRPAPEPAAGRVVQVLAPRDDGSCVRVDAHPSVAFDAAQLRVTLAAAELVLDNTRLTVERSGHLADLAAAQARIVEAGVAQRRRLERDLHDGAQQSLLAVTATLSRAGLTEDAGRMREVVDEARRQLAAALAELRQLARGIHPAAVTQGGLLTGLSSMAARTDRMRLDADRGFDGVRLPAAIESTAYFVVAEAVTNALRHGGSGPVDVEVRRSSTQLCVRVRDAGPGTARLLPGGGLSGLSDRVRALGGELEVDSAPGRGTQVEARLPLADRDTPSTTAGPAA